MITTNMSSNEQKTYSRTAEYRKICKPLVERKRRARINKSLSELKSIILEVVKKDGCQYSKLEKADILEMTVGHLHQLRQQRQITTKPSTEESLDKFRAGFVQCASDVSRFMCQVPQDNPIGERLLSHLNSCIGQLDRLGVTSSVQTPVTTPTQTRYQQPLRIYTPPTSPVSPPLSSNESGFTSVSSSPIHREMSPVSCHQLPSKVNITPKVISEQDSPVWRPW